MGPSQRCEKTPAVQDGVWHLGRRICLLKGCGRSFQPRHPLTRYCSEACRAAARRWHQQQANRRYRTGEQGKCRRREQAGRYRQRNRQREPEPDCSDAEREGYPLAGGAAEHGCCRPGCYERFVPTSRSPLQRFCSAACRQALRRVLVRERRWRQRLALTPSADCCADDFW